MERSADRLEEVLARGRAQIGALSDEDRHRRGEAIAAVADYIGLLRQTDPAHGPERYAFKLEFPDGRWDVAEQELTKEPRVGDLVWFEGSPWQVLGHRSVARMRGNRQHEFLACAPAAA